MVHLRRHWRSARGYNQWSHERNWKRGIQTISPIVMGYFVQASGSWNITFYLCAALNLLGFLLWFVIRADQSLRRTVGFVRAQL